MTFPGFPGQKYQTGLIVFAMPVKGKTAYDMEEAIYAEIDKIVAEGITAEELEAVKQRTRANFIRGLRRQQRHGQPAGLVPDLHG